jgi:predicted acylesterase/phospholipase RssA/CRP-like cAMP-binding protein
VIGHDFSPAEQSALLAGLPAFAGLAPELLAEVVAACELVQVAGDQRLLRRDVPNDSAYVVMHGGLRVIARDAHGRERVFAEAYRGDSVNIVGLVDGVTAAADVYAIRDSVLLRLTRARFTDLGARHPELLVRLAQAVARRTLALLGAQPEWSTWARPGAAAQNLALLVPSRDQYFAQAAADLATTALARYRRIGRVTRQSVDAALGEGAAAISPADARNEAVLAFLMGLEGGHDTLLYECDTTVLPWCGRCLRQADRVLAILRAGRPDHLEEMRPMLERTMSRQQVPQLDVALVHTEQADVPVTPAGWAWLTRQARVHHVRMGDRRDYERLARTLVRSGVALVLSGGGARGIAHVGVLKAFEDARVPVDAIAGTSMGSLVAAAYARGWSADTIMGKMRELFSSRTALYDPTLPFEALLAGRKLERVLRDQFDGLTIENLWLPFFCVSTNLTHAEPHVHDRGELWRAVAASSSIPGIFPPRREGDDQLVDGGVVDNLPIDVMAARFEGAIVASDVNLYGEVTPEPPRSTAGRLVDFARWLNPLRARATAGGPEIFEILLRSSLVGSQRATLASLARGDASLYLPLPVARFGVLEWGAYDDLYQVGYTVASERLASWQPSGRQHAA